MTEKKRRAVLGLGNVLRRDEGLGIFCLEPLRDRLGSKSGIEIVDGGVLGMSLLPLVESCSHLLILDALDAGRAPGAVMELAREEIPLFARLKLSWHQLSFREVLEFAAVRGGLPGRLRLVGAQPADISAGVGLSGEIEAVLPEIVDRALGILERWGLT